MPAVKQAGEKPGLRSRSPIKPSSQHKSRGSTAKASTPAQPSSTTPATAATDDYAVPTREVVKPVGQLALSEKELEEEVGRVLTAANPSAPLNLVRYSHREGGYRPEPIIDQLLHHFALDGCLIHQDSEEAAKERQRREDALLPGGTSRRMTAQIQSRRVTAQVLSRRVTAAQPDFASAGAGPLRPTVAGDASDAHMLGLPPGEETGSKVLRNQFNFTERAAGTGHGIAKTRGTMTEAPPTTSSAGSCTRHDIFDAYVEDQERQRLQEEQNKLKAAAARKGGATGALQLAGTGLHSSKAEDRGDEHAAAQRAMRVVDRMVQQNLFKDVTMDFKYWDDPADAVQQQEGTLLPLWTFTAPQVKGRAVTAIAWSPRYFDLFAVGYGSYDFQAPTTGLVACYSLKSPAQPELSFATPAGVLCLHFHPEHPNLLAIGCYDGSVMVFDVKQAAAELGPNSTSGRGGSHGNQQRQPQQVKPLYTSTARSGKHGEPVWQVCWQRTDSHELQFCSVSSDGRVTLWSVTKNELSFRDLLVLRQLGNGSAGLGMQASGPAGNAEAREEEAEEELGAAGMASGLCLDFHPQQDHSFLVGSEQGGIYKCSTALTGRHMSAAIAHSMPIYTVRWNTHHPRAFLSGSADWTVKLWDTLSPRPVMSFDMGSPVGDVAWAPFSSTVFAAVTEAGRAHVYDLAQNRLSAVCVQRVQKKARLTRLAFNARHPVLLVGDDKGSVTCFKLSPNLRRGCATAIVGSSTSTSSGKNGGSDRRALDRSATVKVEAAPATGSNASEAAEVARLEAVMEVARKSNAGLTDQDWELL